MNYKQAGMIGVTLALALTGLVCSQVVRTRSSQDIALQPTHPENSKPQPSDSPSIASQPSELPSIAPQANDPQTIASPVSEPPSITSEPSDPQISKTSVVTDTSLSYKIESYNSETMGEKRSYGVVFPPGYDQNPTQRYPVVFLLHGGDGGPTDWFEKNKGAALKAIEQLYAAGKLPPSIIITPDGNDRRGRSPYWDPQYIDGPNGKIVTAVGDELVKVVQSDYRTLPTPDFWAIGGLSSGAWGATNVGLHNLNHFSIIFSHSGYFRDKSGSHNSPINLVRKLSLQERKQLRIYLDTGRADSSSLKENRQFHDVLDQLEIENVLQEFPGQHSWKYWRDHLADSLTFVGEQFQLATQTRFAGNQDLKGANRS